MNASLIDLDRLRQALPAQLAVSLFGFHDVLDVTSPEGEPSSSAIDLPMEEQVAPGSTDVPALVLCEALYRIGLHLPSPTPPAMLSKAAAEICMSRYSFLRFEQRRIVAGLLAEPGHERGDGRRVVQAWAIDIDQPARPLKVRVWVDDNLVLERMTSPAHAPPLLPSGASITSATTVRLEVAGLSATATLSTSQSWSDGKHRQQIASLVADAGRLAASPRPASDLTPLVMRRLDGVPDQGSGPRRRIPGFVRYLAERVGDRAQVATPQAAVAWIVGVVFEDPDKRRLFRLSTEAFGLLSEPAFNRRVISHDVSMALFAFWRRHYSTVDIFTETGLRRIQYNFVTAPFLQAGNNRMLITPTMRERLSRPAPGIKAADISWSWFWVLQLEDRGESASLRDPAFARLTSLRETMADLVQPDRLSFSPASWHGYWSTVERRTTACLSRFDMAMLAGLLDEDPGVALATYGPDHCRSILMSRVFSRMPALLALSGMDDGLQVATAPTEQPTCEVALIGYVNQTGLGRNMAMFGTALSGLAPLLFSADTGGCVNGDPRPDVRAKVVVLCLNADRAPEMLARFASLCEGAHIIGFFLWETDQPPQNHILGTQVVDEIWCPTSYVADAYRKVARVPVSNIGKGLSPPPAEIEDTAVRFRPDKPCFQFLCVAEFGSGIMRKNPLDVIRAFEAAFPDQSDDGVRLLVKVREITPTHWSNQDGYWEDLEERVAGDSRIELVVGDLSDDEYWGLLKAADVFVSLHRAEGFGYGAADALMFGRGVIATDHSGVTDFCDETTAYPVRYTLVPTPPAHLASSGYIGHWAEPDIEHAASRMREARADPDGLAARGRNGAIRVRAQYDAEAWSADLTSRIRSITTPAQDIPVIASATATTDGGAPG